eukprot:scaffold1855_cov123-Chaetoceros_neogracile.AAC.4
MGAPSVFRTRAITFQSSRFMYSATKKRPRYPVAPAMSTMINEKPIKQTAWRSASWKFVVVTISFSRVDDVVMSSRLETNHELLISTIHT